MIMRIPLRRVGQARFQQIQPVLETKPVAWGEPPTARVKLGKQRLLKRMRLLLIAASPLLLHLSIMPLPASADAEDLSPYLQRGVEVEETYQIYTRELQTAYARLSQTLRDEAPELYERLVRQPPTQIFGYQILPEIIPDKPGSRKTPRAIPRSFSWPRTARMVETQREKIRTVLEDPLALVPERPHSERMSVYQKLVSDYEALDKARRLVTSQIEHNKLWQRSIHRKRAWYDRGNELYAAIIEHQAILDALSAEDETSFRRAATSMKGLDLTRPRDALEIELRRRERELHRRIQPQSETPVPRPFIRPEQLDRGQWLIHVPVYTDIEDEAFRQKFKAAVERYWRVTDMNDEFRVVISLRPISTEELYQRSPRCRSAPDKPCKAPQPGDAIDIEKHAALFPDDGAALTTGAKVISVKGSGCIVLSPFRMGPLDLAHEFGHVLGFGDIYARGYRDLGDDGYEILEVVPAIDDLMALSGSGRVHRFHFEAILRNGPGSQTRFESPSEN